MKKVFCSALIIFIIIFGALLGIKSLFPLKYQEQILACSREYGLDPNMVCGMIKAESNFDPDAKSNKGAIGLMQVTPETAQWCAEKMQLEGFETEDLYDPETNIQIGTWYYAYLYDHFHDHSMAAAAYNGGISNVKKWLDQEIIHEENVIVDDIPFPETKNYIKKIQRFQMMYEFLYHLEV